MFIKVGFNIFFLKKFDKSGSENLGLGVNLILD